MAYIELEMGLSERKIADHLSVPKTTIHQWLVGNGKAMVVANNAIFDHWLAGETIEEIAKSGKMGHSQVANIINHSIKTKRGGTGIVEQPPIYNVWNISSCDPGFGQEGLSQTAVLRRHLTDDQRAMMAAMWKNENPAPRGKASENYGKPPPHGGEINAKTGPTHAKAVELFNVPEV